MTVDTKQAPHLALASLCLLAWRNLWRNHRRTLIMVAAVAVGVWAMIFMTALMRGMVEDMLRRGIQQLPGHVQLHHPKFLDDPSVVNSMPEPDGQLLQALNSELVDSWYSRIKVPAVIASERESRGLLLLGIDPSAEREAILANASLIEGRFLQSPADKGIVVGERLLQRLETRLGKRVVVMSQDPENDLAEIGVRIAGVYKAEFASQEEMFAYMGKQTLQDMLKINGSVSEVAAFGDDYRHVEPLHQLLKNSANGWAQELSVKPWQEINRYLGSTVNIMDGFVLVWIIVVFLALSFGLANTLVMAVFERVREIGLMMALGMRPKLILWQILIESSFLLLLGLALGNLLAWGSIGAIQDGVDISSVAEGLEMAGMGTTLYPLLLFKDVLSANLVVILLGLLTSFLPAWHASQYDPIMALTKPT
ncbi:MAG: ABC transporter permease [Arenicella sp.]|nr:ABC transporter permease [Arenicella sp.]